MNGYFIDGCPVFGDITSGSYITKGWEIQFPDLSASDDEQFLQLEGALERCIDVLGANERLQAIFYTGNDYEKPISRYEEVTKAFTNVPAVCTDTRAEISSYFRRKMVAEQLIRANVRFFVSVELPKTRPSAFDSVFTAMQRTLSQREIYFDSVVRSLGGNVQSLDNFGAYKELLKFWNPGRDPRKTPDWSLDIEALCREAELGPTDNGLILDGQHMGIWAIGSMPEETWPHTMDSFFALCIPGLRVTLNIERLHSDKEFKQAASEVDKLRKNTDYQSEVAAEEKGERGKRLKRRISRPAKVQIIVIVTDSSKEKLSDKMEAVRAVIDETGARGYRPTLSTSCLGFFKASIPGCGPWNGYKDYWHKIDHKNLAHMIPAHATPEAELSEADWLMWGNQNNLIGGKLFFGSQPSDTLVMGTKGSGKSVILQSIVQQAAHQFKFLAVIDDGFSWIDTCHLLDPSSRPIVLRSKGNITFNAFDTRGQALSPQHLRSASALIHLLAGTSADPDRNADRADLISKTVRDVYDSKFKAWKRAKPEDYYRCAVSACAALRIVAGDFVDAVRVLQEWKGSEPEKARELEAQITEEEIDKVSRDKELGHYIRDYALSTWTPAMFPRLFDVWDELATRKISDKINAGPYDALANRLHKWLSGGEYGALVDGASNVDLGTTHMLPSDPLKVVHFELGDMGDSEKELKGIAGFLISNELRNIIQGMPRTYRKGMIIEEMTAFLRVPNASRLIIDYSERMRKYQCWLAYVFQQYSSLLEADSAVAKAMIGNAQTMMLLRNVNLDDIKTLDAHIHIPMPIRHAISSFPMPEKVKHLDDGYAGFVYVIRSEKKPKFVVGRHIISKRLEAITSSSGDEFEAKKSKFNVAVYQKDEKAA